MGKTTLIENLQSAGNLDTDLINDIDLAQKKQIEKIVLLDGLNGSDELIKDDVDITYFRTLRSGERTTYEDEDGNEGYKQIYNFEREEFAGTVAQVCLASCDFIDPRFSNGYTSTSGNNVSGSGQRIPLNDISYVTRYSRILDCDFENGTLITFEIKYENDQWSGVFYKWNHNVRQFRIGGAASYFYINEVISVDIGDFISIPNGQGGWNAWTATNGNGNLFCSIDEVNNRYVIVFTEKDNKVFNTLILNRQDLTQTVLHKMVLPNEVSWPSNQKWEFKRGAQNSNYGMMYKGKFALPLYTVRTEQEEPIQGVYMCLINPEDSTDIVALETHFYNASGVETDYNTNMPWKINLPLYNSKCGSGISSAWTIKKDKAYIKQFSNSSNYGQNWGFYYKGFMLDTTINYNYVNYAFQLTWHMCPITLAISETLSKPFLKTLNKTLKYTFRIVNMGGYYD